MKKVGWNLPFVVARDVPEGSDVEQQELPGPAEAPPRIGPGLVAGVERNWLRRAIGHLQADVELFQPRLENFLREDLPRPATERDAMEQHLRSDLRTLLGRVRNATGLVAGVESPGLEVASTVDAVFGQVRVVLPLARYMDKMSAQLEQQMTDVDVLPLSCLVAMVESAQQRVVTMGEVMERVAP